MVDGAAREKASVRRGRGGEIFPMDVGEIHPRLFEYRAIGEHPRFPAASFRALPGVVAEFFLAVFFFQRRADPVLQVEEVVAFNLYVKGHVKNRMDRIYRINRILKSMKLVFL